MSNVLKHCRCHKPDLMSVNDRNQMCKTCGGWYTLVFRSLKEMAEVRAIMQAEVDEIKRHARDPDC